MRKEKIVTQNLIFPPHDSLFVSLSRQLKDHSGALDKETRSIKQPPRNLIVGALVTWAIYTQGQLLL